MGSDGEVEDDDEENLERGAAGGEEKGEGGSGPKPISMLGRRWRLALLVVGLAKAEEALRLLLVLLPPLLLVGDGGVETSIGRLGLRCSSSMTTSRPMGGARLGRLLLVTSALLRLRMPGDEGDE